MDQQFWKITDFSEKISEFVQVKHQDKTLSVHYNTVDKWFKALEKKKIHYISRVLDEKVYDEMDLEIGVFIFERRQQKFALDVIYEIIANNMETRPFPIDDSNNQEPAVIQENLDERILSIIKEKAFIQEELINTFKELATSELQKMLPQPKDPEQIRHERMDEAILKMRVELKLEEEAVKKWNQEPSEFRMKRAGLFRKEEDFAKREEYIRNYKNSHLEEAVRKAFGEKEH